MKLVNKKDLIVWGVVAVTLLGLVFVLGRGLKVEKKDSEVTSGLKLENQKLELVEEEKGELGAMEIDKNKKYSAVLQTSEGEIEIELNASQTPITVNNFVSLANKDFYNGTIFHRVMKGFMIQGGDPNGDGTGGPGYTFADEPFTGEYERGVVAMANAGPNTNGSQFFIMHQDYALPKNYVIFGKAVKGMDVVDKIANAPVKAGLSGENSTPVKSVMVESVEIIEG